MEKVIFRAHTHKHTHTHNVPTDAEFIVNIAGRPPLMNKTEPPPLSSSVSSSSDSSGVGPPPKSGGNTIDQRAEFRCHPQPGDRTAPPTPSCPSASPSWPAVPDRLCSVFGPSPPTTESNSIDVRAMFRDQPQQPGNQAFLAVVHRNQRRRQVAAENALSGDRFQRPGRPPGEHCTIDMLAVQREDRAEAKVALGLSEQLDTLQETFCEDGDNMQDLLSRLSKKERAGGL